MYPPSNKRIIALLSNCYSPIASKGGGVNKKYAYIIFGLECTSSSLRLVLVTYDRFERQKTLKIQNSRTIFERFAEDLNTLTVAILRGDKQTNR